MANEPKKRSITGKLVANVLTEREDDFTCNVTYVANRSIKDLCRIRAAKGSKYTAAECESMYNDPQNNGQTITSGEKLTLSADADITVENRSPTVGFVPAEQ